MVRNICKTLVQCEKEGLKPQSLNKYKVVTLDIANGIFSKMSLQCETNYKSQRSAKDTFTISNDAYHELSLTKLSPN